ncbi:MAG: phosphotransferase [Propionicimonas sp.]
MNSGFPGASILTSPQAEDLLRAALAPEGATLESWAIDDVNARPGAETSVGYQVVSSRELNGAPVQLEEYLIASTFDAHDLPSGVVRLINDDPDTPPITLWRHPADPLLPALAGACDLRSVSRLWQRVLPAGTQLGDQTVEVVAYRPMRRAVIRASCGEYQIYLKVVRTKALRDLVRRHRLLVEAGVPTPPVLEHSREGMIVLDHAEGTRGVDRIADAEPSAQHDAISAEVLTDLLDRLPAAAVDLPRRTPWAEHYPIYAEFLDRRLRRTDATDLGFLLKELWADHDLGPTVPTHGDFHAANVYFADTGQVSSLLDVDTLGPGHRVDDLACFLAHLTVLPSLDPPAYPGVPALAARLTEEFGRQVPTDLLLARAAACVVSLACGVDTDRLAQEWLRVAQLLATAAREHHEGRLSDLSSTKGFLTDISPLAYGAG